MPGRQELDSDSESAESDVGEERWKTAGGCCSGAPVFEEAPIDTDPGTLSPYARGINRWWDCMPNADLPRPRAVRGVAAVGPDEEPATMARLAEMAAANKPDAEIFKVERPVPALATDGKTWPPALPDDEWTAWTYKEWMRDVKLAAQGFIQLGFKPFDTVNVWGFNSPEWVMSAIAASFAGGKVAGLYPTDTDETAAYKMVHSGGTIAVVESKKKADTIVKALTARGDCQRMRAIVSWDPEQQGLEATLSMSNRPMPFMSWAKLLTLGDHGVMQQEVRNRVDGTRHGSCAALIYTSGTTGDPKAVMVSHDNLIFITRSVTVLLEKSVGLGGDESAGERFVSYLPLSHVAGMMLDISAPIYMAAMTDSWVTHYFARPYDLKAGSLKDRLCAAKPTLFLGVPLVWEKMADALRTIGASKPAPIRALSGFCKGVLLKHAKACQLGGSGEYPFAYGFASALMNATVKKALGLECLKYGLTGAAPIRADTLEYFGSLGISINEAYGMSECTGATTLGIDQAHAWGSCGWMIPGTEVKAFKVDDRDFTKKEECPRAPNLDAVNDEEYQGELCFRGRHVMIGYLAQTDLGSAHVQEIRKKNAETIDGEGWLHSGDKGMITEAGLVKITGRYKELIIGTGGENIAPVPIEDCVKKACDGISEIMMVGDHRKYNVALVTLKAVSEDSDNLAGPAKAINPGVMKISAAMDDQTWISAITRAIEAANKNGKVCPNNAFKIQKFTILPENFSEEKGHLTPTKKLKRKTVEKEYARMIDVMYQADGVYIRFKAHI